MKNGSDNQNFMNNLQQENNIAVTESYEYESKECKLFVTYEELLQPVIDQDDHELFCGVLACIFDIDYCIIGRLSNLDYIQRPRIKKNKVNVNYIQWITLDTWKLTRNPVGEVLSILFCEKEILYGEPYENTNLTNHKIKMSLNKAITDHGSLQKYLSWVSERLWMKPSFIEENYFRYFDKAKKIDTKMNQ